MTRIATAAIALMLLACHALAPTAAARPVRAPHRTHPWPAASAATSSAASSGPPPAHPSSAAPAAQLNAAAGRAPPAAVAAARQRALPQHTAGAASGSPVLGVAAVARHALAQYTASVTGSGTGGSAATAPPQPAAGHTRALGQYTASVIASGTGDSGIGAPPQPAAGRTRALRQYTAIVTGSGTGGAAGGSPVLPAAAVAHRRGLAQYTASVTGGKVENKDDLTVAATDVAEAISHPRSGGITHNEATRVALSSDRYPAGMSRVATDDLYKHEGAVELQVASFGTVAAAVTDTGVGAFAGSNTMPLAERERTPGTSRANTMAVLDPRSPLTGAAPRRVSGGKRGAGVANVDLQSIGTNLPASTAFAMSEMGDGPHAIAHAGEAIATAYSSTDNDDELQGGTFST